MPTSNRATDRTNRQPERPPGGPAGAQPGGPPTNFAVTALLRLWQRLLNRWRRRLGWERMDTGDLPRLVGHDTQSLRRYKAQANGDGASDEPDESEQWTL